jgi:hypothetical protein
MISYYFHYEHVPHQYLEFEVWSRVKTLEDSSEFITLAIL